VRLSLDIIYAKSDYFLVFPEVICNIMHSNNAPGFSCACDVGYKGTITWNGHTHGGSCVPKTCTGDNVNASEKGAVTKSTEDYHGSMTTFSCNDGYMINDATAIVCNATSTDALWPAPKVPPVCTGMLFHMHSQIVVT